MPSARPSKVTGRLVPPQATSKEMSTKPAARSPSTRSAELVIGFPSASVSWTRAAMLSPSRVTSTSKVPWMTSPGMILKLSRSMSCAPPERSGETSCQPQSEVVTSRLPAVRVAPSTPALSLHRANVVPPMSRAAPATPARTPVVFFCMVVSLVVAGPLPGRGVISWCFLLGLGSGSGGLGGHWSAGGAGHRVTSRQRVRRAGGWADLVVVDGDVLQHRLAGVGDLVGPIDGGAARDRAAGGDRVVVAGAVVARLDDLDAREQAVVGERAGHVLV